jgi:hypothetical protein
MKTLTSLLLLLGLSTLPALAAPQTFHNVPVVDVNCSKKVAADPDSHTRDCALKCEASGFGIVTNDQKFLKFDAVGNKQIEAALKASSKADHLRVDVSGDVEGDTLRVSSIQLL